MPMPNESAAFDHGGGRLITTDMTMDQVPQQPLTPAAPAPNDTAPPPSRRAFLSGALRKAVYVTPVIMTFAASQARAGSVVDSNCGDAGSPCAVDGDCCSGLTCPIGTCV